jgi:hypothetical protein
MPENYVAERVDLDALRLRCEETRAHARELCAMAADASQVAQQMSVDNEQRRTRMVDAGDRRALPDGAR